MIKEVNAGYIIIEKYPCPDLETGVAIGYNPEAPAPYVVWQFRKDTPHDYYWGKHTKSKEKAYEMYQDVITKEYRNEKDANPLLPVSCYVVVPSTGNLISVVRGVEGYYSCSFSREGEREYNQETAEFFNEQSSVTKAEAAAMFHGSLFGWDTPGADPRAYDAAGKLIRKAVTV